MAASLLPPSDTNNGVEQQQLVQDCLERLRQQQIRTVAFDMDLTAVAQHSRGRLPRQLLEQFLDQAVEPFVQLVPALHRAGWNIAITTHSDEQEFGLLLNRLQNIRRETHIMGDELVAALLRRHFEETIVNDILVVAYNPRARGTTHSETNRIKRYHMRRVQEHFGLEAPHEILLLDDTWAVVKDCREHCGVRAIHVDCSTGLQWLDVLRLGTGRETEQQQPQNQT